MKNTANKFTLEEIIKKNCAIKEIKNNIEDMYKESMNKSENEGDFEYHKLEILAEISNLLSLKLDVSRKLIDKYGGV